MPDSDYFLVFFDINGNYSSSLVKPHLFEYRHPLISPVNVRAVYNFPSEQYSIIQIVVTTDTNFKQLYDIGLIYNHEIPTGYTKYSYV